MTYNVDGSLATRTDQRGVVLTYTYDSGRRLTVEGVTTIPGSVDDHVRSIVRTYDDFDRIETISSCANAIGTGTIRSQIKYVYATTGQVEIAYQSHEDAVVTSGSVTPHVTYTWDPDLSGERFSNGNRLKQVEYPSGRTVLNTWAASDSYNDNLLRITDMRTHIPGVGNNTAVAGYRYSGVSRLVRSVYSQPQVRLQFHGSSETDDNYEHLDRFGRVKNQVWEDYSGTPFVVDQVDYTYDAAGNRTSRDIPDSLYATDDRDQVYGYDSLHRLTSYQRGTLSGSSISGTPEHEQDWSLEQQGNWSTLVEKEGGTTTLDQDRIHNDANELDNDNNHSTTPGDVFDTTTGDDWATPVVYDAAGNMTQFPQPAALTSNYTVKYDAWNRMVEVKSGGTVVLTNEYDGLGRRIFKDVNAGGSTDDRHYYYNEEWQLLETRKTEGGSALEQFIWHPYYIDALALRFHDANGNGSISSDEVHYALHDANFNVTAVIDNSGDVLERYHYTPYGAVTFLEDDFDPIAASTIGNVHLYTGRERDPETGLQLNRHRFYHAQLGRWLTRDPIGYEGSPWNLYEYVGGIPTIDVDPMGRQAFGWNCYELRSDDPEVIKKWEERAALAACAVVVISAAPWVIKICCRCKPKKLVCFCPDPIMGPGGELDYCFLRSKNSKTCLCIYRCVESGTRTLPGYWIPVK